MTSKNQRPSTSLLRRNFVRLKIKTLLAPDTYDIEVNIESSVRDVKRSISDKVSMRKTKMKTVRMDPANQALLYGDAILSDDELLKNLELPNDAVLTLIPKMRSGPIDFRINTDALQKQLNRMEQEIAEMLKRSEINENKPPSKNDVILMMFVDHQARLLKLSGNGKLKGKDEKRDAPIEINLETWDKLGENDRTRQKMANIKQKLEEMKERKKKKPSKPLKDLVLVDAEMIIDESDWEKLLELSSEEQEESKTNSTVAKSHAHAGNKVKVDEMKDAGRVTKVDDNDKGIQSSVVPNASQIASSLPIPTVSGEPTSDKECKTDEESEFDQFFDCADVVDDDQKDVWIEFQTWVHRKYVHHKIKELEKANKPDEDEFEDGKEM